MRDRFPIPGRLPRKICWRNDLQQGLHVPNAIVANRQPLAIGGGGIGLAFPPTETPIRKEISMTTIQRSVELEVPAETAYAVWTCFESFPEFMESVDVVEESPDNALHWRAHFFGKKVEWESRIAEQVPGERIAWYSTEGPRNSGVVTFEDTGSDISELSLQLVYEPHNLVEALGDMFGLVGHRVGNELQSFKHFIEEHRDDREGTRGGRL